MSNYLHAPWCALVLRQVQWGWAQTQTLVDLAPLARYLAPDRHDAILMPPVQGTEMELADCSCIPDSFCGAGYDLAAT